MSADDKLLEALLAQDPSSITAEVYLPRLGGAVKIRGLTPEKVRELRERCTWVKKDGTENFDQVRFNDEMLAAAIVEPNLSDPRLLEKYRAQSAAEVVARAFLAGEYTALLEKALTLSGEVEIEEIKNS